MIANISIALVAVLHFWFFILETFLWTKPLGRKVFNLDPTFANQSAALAANQGLYNLFLVAGLIWGLVVKNPIEAFHVKLFFLNCVIIAGVYAGVTVSRRIFVVQALPAMLTLLILGI